MRNESSRESCRFQLRKQHHPRAHDESAELLWRPPLAHHIIMIGVYTSVFDSGLLSSSEEQPRPGPTESRTKPRLANTGTDASADQKVRHTLTDITSPQQPVLHPSIFAAVTPSVRVPYAVTRCPGNMSSSSKYAEADRRRPSRCCSSLIRRVKLSSVITERPRRQNRARACKFGQLTRSERPLLRSLRSWSASNRLHRLHGLFPCFLAARIDLRTEESALLATRHPHQTGPSPCSG